MSIIGLSSRASEDGEGPRLRSSRYPNNLRARNRSESRSPRTEGEIQAAPEHAEIVFRSFENVPGKIVGPADVGSDANFQTGTELAIAFVLPPKWRDCALTVGNSFGASGIGWSDHGVTFASAKDGTSAGPGIRRITRAGNRIAHGECSESRSDCSFVVGPLVNEDLVARIEQNVEAILFRVQGKTLKSDTEVTVEEVFNVSASAPGMIVSQVFVECAEDCLAFGGALDQVRDVEIGAVFGSREGVGPPQTDVPFKILIELRTRRARPA